MLANRTDNKNLKDSTNDLDIIIKDMPVFISYTKTNKLITALYMVTDIMAQDEPLKNKLRTLGTEIISDMHTIPPNALVKIYQIMSFLDIARALDIISEMNTSILRKEFLELDQSIKESNNRAGIGITKPQTNRQINLSEFFRDEISLPKVSSNRQHIGVQKGSTLLKAIKDMSNRVPAPYEAEGFRSGSDKKPHIEFEILKKQRREEIISIIKTSVNGATITDIKSKATGSLVSCGEKTLQRELVSMVKDNVLDKTGEKRWSRYKLVNLAG